MSCRAERRSALDGVPFGPQASAARPYSGGNHNRILEELMSSCQNPAVDFEVDEVCQRFSIIYTGAISDVLDELGYHHQVLPAVIQGLTMDQQVTGVAMPVEGQPADSVDPEVVYIPIL